MDKKLLFKRIQKSRKSEKAILIPALCAGKRVLDVGCVGQDIDYNNPGWLHNKIRNAAISLDGVDIADEGIRALRDKGYSIYTPDELRTSGKSYDLIVMSDVIEHVNDPIVFLKFYSAFLAEKGSIIITTPNAHGIRNFTNILFRNDFAVNTEHTFWFCAKTIMEVAERAELNFVEFYWLDEYFKLNEIKEMKFKIIHIINRFFMKMRSNFYPNFMIILSK